VTPAQARQAVEDIFDWAARLIEEGSPTTVLTVDNYADGPALYLRTARRDPARAESVARALAWNGGARNASGRALAAVDWEGNVRADQFWSGPAFGSVRERPLSEIWTSPPPALEQLRGRTARIGGRCASCRFLELCGGGLASRALASTGELHSSDPGCHLTDAEIAGAPVAAA
jgi:radical SAM protein with 4Fe4S-binding SPASM domain